jgi:hypothetical protein
MQVSPSPQQPFGQDVELHLHEPLSQVLLPAEQALPQLPQLVSVVSDTLQPKYRLLYSVLSQVDQLSSHDPLQGPPEHTREMWTPLHS